MCFLTCATCIDHKWLSIGQNLAAISCSLRLQLPFKKIDITTYFENLTIGLHVLYVFNTYIKFCANQILFTIWFISLYFMHNLKYKNLQFKQFIDDIAIDI